MAEPAPRLRAVLSVRDGGKDRPVSAVQITASSADETLRSLSQAQVYRPDPTYGHACIVVDYIRGWVPRGRRVAQMTLTDPTRHSEWRRFAGYLRHGLDGTSAPKAAILAQVKPGVDRDAQAGGGASQARYVLAPPEVLDSASPAVLDVFDLKDSVSGGEAVRAPWMPAVAAPGTASEATVAAKPLPRTPPMHVPPSSIAARKPTTPPLPGAGPGAQTLLKLDASSSATVLRPATPPWPAGEPIPESMRAVSTSATSLVPTEPVVSTAHRPGQRNEVGAALPGSKRARPQTPPLPAEFPSLSTAPKQPQTLPLPASAETDALHEVSRIPALTHAGPVSPTTTPHALSPPSNDAMSPIPGVERAGPLVAAAGTSGLAAAAAHEAAHPKANDTSVHRAERHKRGSRKDRSSKHNHRTAHKRDRPHAALNTTGEPYVAPHGHEYVPGGDVAECMSSGRQDAVVSRVVERIVAAEIPFPYKRFCITLASMHSWFEHLQHHRGPVLRCAAYKLHGYLDAGRVASCVIDAPLQRAGPDEEGAVWLANGKPRRIDTINPTALQLVMGASPAFLPFDDELNEMAGNLIDYFTEDARMAAVRKGEEAAPHVLWRRPNVAKAVVEKALRKYHEVTDYSLRHGMYGNVGTCNLFKPNLARSLYMLLGGTRILDMCAGWGCRLMGALACPGVTRYLGCDPNPALEAGHAGIIRTFGPLSSAKCEVVSQRFEDLVISEADIREGFDLALTSPPYFDLEVYEPRHEAESSSHGQSIDNHPTLSRWLAEWYFPMMDKAWSVVRPGGHMAIYINDHAREGEDTLDICHPMLQHAASLPDNRWVGILGIEGETGSVRPLWIWRKADLPTDRLPPPLYSEIASHAAILQPGDELLLRGATRKLDAVQIGVAVPSVQPMFYAPTGAEVTHSPAVPVPEATIAASGTAPGDAPSTKKRPISLDILGKLRPPSTASSSH